MSQLTDRVEEVRNEELVDKIDALQEEKRLVVEEASYVIASLVEAWGDPVDRTEWRWSDDTGNFQSTTPVTNIDDRRFGQNRPIFENELELAAIRGASRILHDTSPHTQTVTQNLLNFVDGLGFTYKVQPKRSGVEELVREVQWIIDEFMERNEWQCQHECREEEIITRSIRDGEVFLALYDRDGTGRATARFVEPDQVTEPQNVDEVEAWINENYGYLPDGEWRFGVHTPIGDVEDVHGYFVQFDNNGEDWDYLDSSRMARIKLNVDRNIKRGISSFYSVQEYLTSVGKLERNVVKGSAILSAILGIRQHAPGTKKSEVESLIANAKYRQYTQSTPAGNRTRNVAKFTPGSWLDVSNGLEYKPPPLATQGVGQAFVDIDQATLRTIGLPWQLPEYMISGDSSNANFASAMVAEAPVVKRFEREQGLFGGDFAKIMWQVVKMAYAGGRFPGMSFDDIKRAVAIVVTGPRVAARDANVETNRNKILYDNGQLSARGWSEAEGIDYDLEQSRGAEVQSHMLQQQNVPAAPGRPSVTSESDRREAAASLLWGDYARP
jgi:hypothetical protein